MPAHWECLRYEQLILPGGLSYGIVQPGSHFPIGGVPIVRVNNIKQGRIVKNDALFVEREIEEKYSRTRLRGGELLITVVGIVGQCAIVPEDMAGWNVARAVSVSRIAHEFDARFISYCFLHEPVRYQVYSHTMDTVQPTLNLSALKQVCLPAPPLGEQRAIASVLSCLDDKIDLLHRENTTLEQLAEAVWRQWFLEEANRLQEIALKDIADHVKESISPSKQPTLLFSHYSVPAYDNGREPKKELGKNILSNKFRVISDSILISKLNPRFPRVWPVFGQIDETLSICSTEFQVVKPKNKNYFGFIYCFLKSPAVTQELENAVGGTSGSHQRVDPEVIFDLSFPKPPDDKSEEFAKLTNHYWLKIDENLDQIRTLAQMRDTLLPKLMSGEVRVKY
ncbi:MAG: restriction endonuclease subunit S [Bacteroidota bacterium]